MGHLVNPISFRLGRTQNWRSSWYEKNTLNYVNTLKQDFILYNYIECFFKYAQFLKKRETKISFSINSKLLQLRLKKKRRVNRRALLKMVSTLNFNFYKTLNLNKNLRLKMFFS